MSKKLSGTVVEVNATGDLITDIPAADLSGAPTDSSLRIVIEEHETYGVYPPEHEQPAMTLIAILPSDASLKITLVGDSASGMLGVQVGAAVEVSW